MVNNNLNFIFRQENECYSDEGILSETCLNQLHVSFLVDFIPVQSVKTTIM